MRRVDIARCINDHVANKMWLGDIVEVLDPATKKYRGIKGETAGEEFWCVAEVEVLPEEQAARFR